ncbi:DUF3306 domain-containing protein [Alphaproteobacteria bacterium]|jgi:hypothetical protein|nr:DUF3306 domain-containing protein [Alphaproteobacteria bacterium]
MMSKDGDSKPSDLTGGESGFLTRWSARKTQIAQGLEVPEEAADDAALAADDADHQAAESDEDAALSDAELLEKYELPDPAEIEEEAGLDKFFDGKTPERLRQMALRRLWRINPFFGFVDEMVEYGEDYTDAATVIEGMQTAYQAGKGYLQKVLSPEEEAAEQAKLAAEEAPSAENDENATDSDKPTEDTPEETPEESPEAQTGAEADEDVSQNTQTTHQHDTHQDNTYHDDTHHDDTVSQANRSSLDNAAAKPAAIAEVEPVAPRPKRMKFNVKPTR